ncbi:MULTISPECIES: hypothetical protein [Streptomyces]|uniref:CHAT domain-containing protein n=1 Tax=Streptomyces dengpaensis TaxID=2049881 RepID=A0ABN5I146_9ACTN|nr:MULTISPECIES: hypothetical protein [Streptomyces]AVH55322.1 hypothetical protein C4B68_05430 [Streptomyces dengpaensis]PIB06967.1 hypothetical protein B1C81_21580 [Streptomyces sp. HG99]
MTGDGHPTMGSYLRAAESMTAAESVPPRQPARREPGDDLDEIPDDVDTASKPKRLRPKKSDITGSLPADAAMLRVMARHSRGEPSFTLFFHYRQKVRRADRPHELEEQRPPKLALADLGAHIASSKAANPWAAKYYEIAEWWRTKHRLEQWIDRLRAEQPDPQLVVWDQTAFEIPWELYYHDPDPESRCARLRKPAGWLGALLPLIRWTTVHAGRRALSYSAAMSKLRGGVLVCEDEQLEFAPDTFAAYQVGERSKKMEHLLDRLSTSDETFGLLLIRCHGRYSTDLNTFTLGDIPYNQLAYKPMPALQRTGAVVLINSCVSGRTVTDSAQPSVEPRSFAEIFLRKGAGAVIATVGDVELLPSHEFALWLVDRAADAQHEGEDDRGLNLAAALTEYRRGCLERAERALRGGNPAVAEKEIRRFFNSCMYVYFGHPGTTLRTTTVRGEDAGP